MYSTLEIGVADQGGSRRIHADPHNFDGSTSFGRIRIHLYASQKVWIEILINEKLKFKEQINDRICLIKFQDPHSNDADPQTQL